MPVLVGGPRSQLIDASGSGYWLPGSISGGIPPSAYSYDRRSGLFLPPQTLLVQNKAFTNTGSTTLVCVLDAAPQNGNSLVAWITDPSVSAVRATGAETGAVWNELANRGNAVELVVLAAFGVAGASATVTITFDNSGNHIVEISEWQNIGSMNQTTQNSASLTTITTGSITPGATDVLVMVGFDINAAGTWGDEQTGFTNLWTPRQGNTGVQPAFMILDPGVATTARNASWTQSAGNGNDAIIMSFNPPVVAPATDFVILGGGFFPNN